MLDRELVKVIYESSQPLGILSEESGLSKQTIIDIQIGNLLREETEELIPGMLIRHKRDHLDDLEVFYILHNMKDSTTQEIKDKFLISESSIRKIRKGVNYKRVFNNIPVEKSKVLLSLKKTNVITPDEVKFILKLLVKGKTHSEITKLLPHVNHSMISGIRNNKTWKFIPRPQGLLKFNNTYGNDHSCRKVKKEFLIRLLVEGFSVTEISRKLKVSESTVRRALHTFKLHYLLKKN